MTFTRTFAATVTGLALMAILPSVSMAQGQADTASIRQALQHYEQALNRSDTAAIVALYTPDGVQMAPDAPAAVGREGVRAAYDATFKAIALNLRFTVDDIKLVGQDAAVTAVAVVVTTGSPSAPVCTMDTFQCWVERLVRTGVASTVNGPVVGAPA